MIAEILVEEEVRSTIVETLRPLPLRSKSCNKKQSAISNYNTMRETVFMKRWPKQITCPGIQQFYNQWDSLSIVKGCLMIAELVVPQKLRAQMLKGLHVGHSATIRMISFARSIFIGQGLTKMVEGVARQCQKGAAGAKQTVKTTLASWPEPKGPWSHLHIDYAGSYKRHYFLAMVDALSKWPEIQMTSSMSSTVTVKRC